MIPSRWLAPLFGAAIVVAFGCTSRPPVATVPAGSGETIAVYRGQVWDGSRRHPKFRLLLYARPPDHIHAELYPPVGTAAWVLDSGQGRLSLTVVEERVAYVGAADAHAFGQLFGIAIAPAALVAALLDGTVPGDGIAVARHPQEGSRLPASFEIRDGARGFRLELIETRPVVTRGLATGNPPAGMRQVPLQDLALEKASD